MKGILQLIYTNEQNYYLNSSPNFTFFKLVYNKYSNFSQNISEINITNNPDFGKKYIINIPKNGDLLDNIFFKLTLPKIDCQYKYNKFEEIYIKKKKIIYISNTELNNILYNFNSILNNINETNNYRIFNNILININTTNLLSNINKSYYTYNNNNNFNIFFDDSKIFKKHDINSIEYISDVLLTKKITNNLMEIVSNILYNNNYSVFINFILYCKKNIKINSKYKIIEKIYIDLLKNITNEDENLLSLNLLEFNNLLSKDNKLTLETEIYNPRYIHIKLDRNYDENILFIINNNNFNLIDIKSILLKNLINNSIDYISNENFIINYILFENNFNNNRNFILSNFLNINNWKLIKNTFIINSFENQNNLFKIELNNLDNLEINQILFGFEYEYNNENIVLVNNDINELIHYEYDSYENIISSVYFNIKVIDYGKISLIINKDNLFNLNDIININIINSQIKIYNNNWRIIRINNISNSNFTIYEYILHGQKNILIQNETNNIISNNYIELLVNRYINPIKINISNIPKFIFKIYNIVNNHIYLNLFNNILFANNIDQIENKNYNNYNSYSKKYLSFGNDIIECRSIKLIYSEIWNNYLFIHNSQNYQIINLNQDDYYNKIIKYSNNYINILILLIKNLINNLFNGELYISTTYNVNLNNDIDSYYETFILKNYYDEFIKLFINNYNLNSEEYLFNKFLNRIINYFSSDVKNTKNKNFYNDILKRFSLIFNKGITNKNDITNDNVENNTVAFLDKLNFLNTTSPYIYIYTKRKELVYKNNNNVSRNIQANDIINLYNCKNINSKKLMEFKVVSIDEINRIKLEINNYTLNTDKSLFNINNIDIISNKYLHISVNNSDYFVQIDNLVETNLIKTNISNNYFIDYSENINGILTNNSINLIEVNTNINNTEKYIKLSDEILQENISSIKFKMINYGIFSITLNSNLNLSINDIIEINQSNQNGFSDNLWNSNNYIGYWKIFNIENIDSEYTIHLKGSDDIFYIPTNVNYGEEILYYNIGSLNLELNYNYFVASDNFTITVNTFSSGIFNVVFNNIEINQLLFTNDIVQIESNSTNLNGYWKVNNIINNNTIELFGSTSTINLNDTIIFNQNFIIKKYQNVVNQLNINSNWTSENPYYYDYNNNSNLFTIKLCNYKKAIFNLYELESNRFDSINSNFFKIYLDKIDNNNYYFYNNYLDDNTFNMSSNKYYISFLINDDNTNKGILFGTFNLYPRYFNLNSLNMIKKNTTYTSLRLPSLISTRHYFYCNILYNYFIMYLFNELKSQSNIIYNNILLNRLLIISSKIYQIIYNNSKYYNTTDPESFSNTQRSIIRISFFCDFKKIFNINTILNELFNLNEINDNFKRGILEYLNNKSYSNITFESNLDNLILIKIINNENIIVDNPNLEIINYFKFIIKQLYNESNINIYNITNIAGFNQINLNQLFHVGALEYICFNYINIINNYYYDNIEDYNNIITSNNYNNIGSFLYKYIKESDIINSNIIDNFIEKNVILFHNENHLFDNINYINTLNSINDKYIINYNIYTSNKNYLKKLKNIHLSDDLLIENNFNDFVNNLYNNLNISQNIIIENIRENEKYNNINYLKNNYFSNNLIYNFLYNFTFLLSIYQIFSFLNSYFDNLLKDINQNLFNEKINIINNNKINEEIIWNLEKNIYNEIKKFYFDSIIFKNYNDLIGSTINIVDDNYIKINDKIIKFIKLDDKKLFENVIIDFNTDIKVSKILNENYETNISNFEKNLFIKIKINDKELIFINSNNNNYKSIEDLEFFINNNYLLNKNIYLKRGCLMTKSEYEILNNKNIYLIIKEINDYGGIENIHIPLNISNLFNANIFKFDNPKMLFNDNIIINNNFGSNINDNEIKKNNVIGKLLNGENLLNNNEVDNKYNSVYKIKINTELNIFKINDKVSIYKYNNYNYLILDNIEIVNIIDDKLYFNIVYNFDISNNNFISFKNQFYKIIDVKIVNYSINKFFSSNNIYYSGNFIKEWYDNNYHLNNIYLNKSFYFKNIFINSDNLINKKISFMSNNLIKIESKVIKCINNINNFDDFLILKNNISTSSNNLIFKNSFNLNKYVKISLNDIEIVFINNFKDYMRHENGQSKILGISLDGYPIYGPFKNENDIYLSSYKLKSSIDNYRKNYIYNFNNNIVNNLGYFVNDYQFDNNYELDIFNGKFVKTIEFPLGTYAYFFTFNYINDNLFLRNIYDNLIPSFPYIIGNKFKNKINLDNTNYNFNIVNYQDDIDSNVNYNLIGDEGLYAKFKINNNKLIIINKGLNYKNNQKVYLFKEIPDTLEYVDENKLFLRRKSRFNNGYYYNYELDNIDKIQFNIEKKIILNKFKLSFSNFIKNNEISEFEILNNNILNILNIDDIIIQLSTLSPEFFDNNFKRNIIDNFNNLDNLDLIIENIFYYIYNKFSSNYKLYYNKDIVIKKEIKLPNIKNNDNINSLILNFLSDIDQNNKLLNEFKILEKKIINRNDKPKFSWIKNISNFLFKDISLYFNDLLIDKIYPEWSYIIDNINVDIDKLNLIKKINGNFKNLIEYNDKVKHEKIIYFPLKLWFCINKGQNLPLIAMNNTDILLILNTEEIKNLVKLENNDNEIVILSRLNISIVLNNIFLSENERKLISNSKHEYLIQNSQLNILYNFDENKKNIYELKFRNNIKDLYYFLYYNNKYILPIYDIFKDGNPILNSKLIINGIQIFNQTGHYTNYIIPYELYKKTPKDGINIINFNLFNNKQPSGSLNFSILDKVYLELEIKKEFFKNKNKKLLIFSNNYNILKIIGGQASLEFIQ